MRTLGWVLLHLAAILGSAAVGSLAGMIIGRDGHMEFFVPVALLAGAAAYAVRRVGPPHTAVVPWIPVLVLAAFVASVNEGLGEDLEKWLGGMETQFIGTGFCGDLVCMGQAYATAPLIAAIVYALILCVEWPPTVRHLMRDATVIGLALFAVIWLALSAATQDPPALLHIYPYSRGGAPVPTDVWSRTSTAPDYLALSLPAKLARATAFFDSTLGPQLRRSYFDADGYRRAFLTASLESPLGTSGLGFAYRQLDVHGYPGREIRRMTRHATVLAVIGTSTVLAVGWVLGRRRRTFVPGVN